MVQAGTATRMELTDEPRLENPNFTDPNFTPISTDPIYYEDHSPTLGDMAMADDDQLFEGEETGYIRSGVVTHKAN